MEQNEQNPMTETPMQSEPPKKEGGMGAMVASVVVILIIIIGGIYIVNIVKESQSGDAMMEDDKMMEKDGDAMMEENGDSMMEKSDSVSDIESELNSEDLDNLDAELESIDSEFDSL